MQQVGHSDTYTVYLSALEKVPEHIYVRQTWVFKVLYMYV